MKDFFQFTEHEFAEFAKKVFESTPYFISIDAEGKIFYINSEYAKIMGIPQADLIGQPVKDVIPWSKLPDVMKENRIISSCVHIYDENQVFPIDSNNVCHRYPIKDGDEIVGAAGITSFTSFKDLFEVYEEARSLQKTQTEASPKIGSSLDMIIGNSKPIWQLKKVISAIAYSNISVHISGETGTGKELIADAIQAASKVSKGPYVKINCASVPSSLIESELFGYAPGAFTGASKAGVKGKFVLADNGTILLDEIGEMPLDMQAKLLRVLQEGTVTPIGSSKDIPVKIRLISSTNRNLSELVKEGKFRQDLYYRLNSMEISAPALRDHKEDIPSLCNHFVKRNNLLDGTNIQRVDEEVYLLLKQYDWPGNVRELMHVIERACILKKSGMLTPRDFKFLLEKIVPPAENSETVTFKAAVEQTEKEVILSALIHTRGNKMAAAKYLDMDRSMLYAKIKKYKISLDQLSSP